jgi:hypothetical protein
LAWASELLTKYGADKDWPSEKIAGHYFGGWGHDINDEDIEHILDCCGFSTMLMIAARKEDLPMVNLLLKHGNDVNKTFGADWAAVSLWKASHNESENENEDESEDESEDEIESLKETPLSVALKTGNAAIIELLKSKGATKFSVSTIVLMDLRGLATRTG